MIEVFRDPAFLDELLEAHTVEEIKVFCRIMSTLAEKSGYNEETQWWLDAQDFIPNKQ